MSMQVNEPIQYCILDPTGNITALVESDVDPAEQPSVADRLMRKHPDVEQVGFACFKEDKFQAGVLQGELRMAGGEFCGNASMCAAVLYCRRKQVFKKPVKETDTRTVSLFVSGAKEPVKVTVSPISADSFRARITMPEALSIAVEEFNAYDFTDRLPVVRMDGITHLIIAQNSVFFSLKNQPEKAEQIIITWCRALSAAGLGLLFLEESEAGFQLTPLVYIPESHTVFWEHSCASGSGAVGMYLSAQKKEFVEIKLQEPGGILLVQSDFHKHQTFLEGSVKILQEFQSLH